MGLFNCKDMDGRTEKVIILAADATSKLKNGMPSCFSNTRGGRTILETQIQTLCLYNINKINITVVVGQKGPWENLNISSTLINEGVKFIVNDNNINTTSQDSLKLGLNSLDIKDESSVIVLYSDFTFNTNDLDKLFLSPKSTMLVRKAKSISERSIRISQKDSFPWDIFAGVLKLNSSDIGKLNFSNKNNNVIEFLNLNLSFVTYNLDTPNIQSHLGKELTFDLAGGSYASLYKKTVVRKEVKGEGALKLENEIYWLENFSQQFPEIFPYVVDKHLSKELVWYEMPFYDLPSLRKLIICYDITLDETLNLVKNILNFMFEEVYSNTHKLASLDFIKTKHFDRVYYRLFDVFDYSQDYKNLILKEKITINGRPQKNLPELFSNLLSITELERIVRPTELIDIHGDLHFQNILVNRENFSFVLADPRGEIEGSDIYYDLGKLWHSINGLYDLIHTNQFDLKISQDFKTMDLIFNNNSLVNFYTSLIQKIENHLLSHKLISDDPYYKEKILFNEVMHFCSVFIFHLNRYGDERRSMAMYVMGITLMDNFLELESIKKLKKSNNPLYYFSSLEEFKKQLIDNKPKS